MYLFFLGKSLKNKKLIFGELVEVEGGEINLVPLKVYEVEDHVNSRLWKQKAVKRSENIEEVVVESLGPFSDDITITKIKTASSKDGASKKTLQPSNISYMKSKFSKVPDKSNQNILDKLVETVVSDSEDYHKEDDSENDPDYRPAEPSQPQQEKETETVTQDGRNKTEEDFVYNEETNNYTCRICNSSLKTKQSVKAHMKKVCKKKVFFEVLESEFDKKTNKYTCKNCAKVFKSLQTISAHKRDVCGKAPKHECMLCDYKGRNPTVLRVHMGKKHGKWGKLDKNSKWSYL